MSEREIAESMLKKSKLTVKDVEEIDKKIKKGLFERHYQKISLENLKIDR